MNDILRKIEDYFGINLDDWFLIEDWGDPREVGLLPTIALFFIMALGLITDKNSLLHPFFENLFIIGLFVYPMILGVAGIVNIYRRIAKKTYAKISGLISLLLNILATVILWVGGIFLFIIYIQKLLNLTLIKM